VQEDLKKQTFITRLVKAGKFNNQSETVREAVRRRQRQETDYLTPPPLTPTAVEAIYGREDKQADTVGRGAFKALRAAARKGLRVHLGSTAGDGSGQTRPRATAAPETFACEWDALT
jgi:Arc/MetJ-type ribon-helix-helix transcriptional regulator